VKPFNDVVPIEEANTPLASNQQFKADISFPARAAAPDLTRFGYLFRDLQADPANLLPTSPQTVQALKELGSTMNDPGNGLTLDSKIPSAYTYFGQFIDHDSTLMMIPGESKLNDPLSDPNLAPLLLTEIDKIKNLRTPALDLDSV